MAAAPQRTALNDTYPNPSNSVFKTGIGALWDFITGLLGITGAKEDALDALRILSPGAVYNLSLVPSVDSSALTMNVKTRAGATPSATDPVMVSMRNTILGSGDFNLRTITAALSLVISSGSTLGHPSTLSSPLYWYVIEYGGVLELAVSFTFFGVRGIVSTTAEGGAGAADSGLVMYSATARADVPYTYIGYTLDAQAAAGTWAAVPSAVHLAPFAPPEIAFSAHKNAVNQTGIVSGANTIVTFSTELFDKSGHFGGSAFTPPPGIYRLNAAVLWVAGVDQAQSVAMIFKNGSLLHSGPIVRCSGTGNYSTHVSVDVVANGTDYFAVYVIQNSGSNQDIDGAVAYTYFTCSKRG